MPVQYRYAASNEYPAIGGFLNEYWAGNHIYCRDRALFEWTFHRKGFWPEDQYSFAVAEYGGELVGVLGGIPFAFNRFGRVSAGIWMANYVIRPDYRKGTTALQLLAQLRQPRFSACVAYGITPASTVIYKVMHGEVLPPIPRSFVVMRGGLDRMLNLLSIAHPEWPAERARALAQPFVMAGMPERNVEHREAIPDDWDRADWPSIAASTIGAVRDRDYLSWRYLDHPVFKYHIIAVPEGGRAGLAVWRLETIRRETHEGRVDVDKIGRLVEFLPASHENARDLATVFLQKVCASGAFAADFYGYHGKTRGWLEAAGLRPVSLHPDGENIPARFQPLDGKGGRILSAMFLDEKLPACGDAADCSWYWTKSDSDQDRPN